MSPGSEQRKKYSNSNVIMHETSQYHVQVRPRPQVGPAPREHPQDMAVLGLSSPQKIK